MRLLKKRILLVKV